MGHIFRILFAVLITALFIMRPVLSFADDHHDGDGHGHGHGSGYHDSGHHDHSYIGVGFSVWPDNYYYGAPYYPAADEVLVSPPVMVVEQPPTVVQPPQVVTQAAPAPVITTMGTTTSDDADSFTINIPNDKGGYTAVTLKKSGNGFIGPQGEFYPEFPKVSQLKVIYGK